MTQLRAREGAAETAPSARTKGAGGRRLAAAFDSASSLPVLADACERLGALAGSRSISSADLLEIVEGDAALTIAVMQAANNGNGHRRGDGGIPAAIDALGADRVVALVERIDTYDLLAPTGSGAERYELFRRHAAAVRGAAEQVADFAQVDERDELAVAALVHDVGRLVLGELYGPEFGVACRRREGPDDRVRRERRELGIDHALVGAVLVRRWRLADRVAQAVEGHHAPDAKGLAAAVRLADQIVHRAAGDPVSPDAMKLAAEALGLGDDALRELLFEYPRPPGTKRRSTEPCPLSGRELDALRGLAAGMVYKQIAAELSLSVSTVRTHLHNVYRKIGAVDRAQAVLFARDRGWI
ncbi:MAG: HDOD domain-containing protein [Actinomycetota bacterium]|nr:HDOD domain-containing protein [Actinomycetota bacterium]